MRNTVEIHVGEHSAALSAIGDVETLSVPRPKKWLHIIEPCLYHLRLPASKRKYVDRTLGISTYRELGSIRRNVKSRKLNVWVEIKSGKFRATTSEWIDERKNQMFAIFRSFA